MTNGISRKAAAATAMLATVVVTGCGQEVPRTDDSGAVVGTVRTLVYTYPDKHVEYVHRIQVGDGDDSDALIPLRFDRMTEKPALRPGERLRVWGERRRDGIAVSAIEPIQATVSEISRLQAALTNPTPTSKKGVFVILGSTDLTKDSAKSIVFSAAQGLSESLLRDSFHALQITGDVVTLGGVGCDFDAATRLRSQVPGSYDYYMWYFGPKVGCDFDGVAELGSIGMPAKNSGYRTTATCVLNQEVAHDFGLQHSATLSCRGTTMSDNTSSCDVDEYGSRLSPMGDACGHLTGQDKWYAGMLGGCNGVRVSASGSFTLLPLEIACNGIQSLRIRMPKTSRTVSDEPVRNYYLELRVPNLEGESSAVKTPAVYVHLGADIQPANRSSYHSFQLDMNPSTSGFDGMSAGQTFKDPAGGLSFTVSELDAKHAKIDVKYDTDGTAATCMDGSPLVGSGPAECGGATDGAGGMGGGSGSGGSGSGGGAGGRAGGTGGAGGRSASGGSNAGATGGAGSGGSGAGSGGRSGTGGTMGTGGGAAGSGGSGSGGSFSGTGGGPITGSGGTTGSGGSGVIIGTGGAGTSSTGGRPAAGEQATTVVGACSCSTGATGAGSPFAAVAGLAVAFGFLARRRRRS